MISWAVVAATLLLTPVPFDSYPGEAGLTGAPIAPQLDSPRARKYRTVLKEGAQRGPNFNGHYRVVHWGCGTNCIEWAVVDFGSGRVWFAPDPVLSCSSADEPADAKVPDWFEIRLNSRLLGLNDCAAGYPRQTFNRQTLYEWQNGAMRRVIARPTGR